MPLSENAYLAAMSDHTTKPHKKGYRIPFTATDIGPQRWTQASYTTAADELRINLNVYITTEQLKRIKLTQVKTWK